MTRIDSYEDLTDKIVGWLKDYYFDNDIDAFVIGVSGGIDSAVVSSLCARTGLPTYVVCMPLILNFKTQNSLMFIQKDLQKSMIMLEELK